MAFIRSNLAAAVKSRIGDDNNEERKEFLTSHARSSDTGFHFQVSCGSRSANSGSRKSNRSMRFPCMNYTNVYNTEGQPDVTSEIRMRPTVSICPYCDFISEKTSTMRQHIHQTHKGHVVCVQDIQHPSNILCNIRIARQCVRQ